MKSKRSEKKAKMDKLIKDGAKIPKIEVKLTENNREYFEKKFKNAFSPDRIEG